MIDDYGNSVSFNQNGDHATLTVTIHGADLAQFDAAALQLEAGKPIKLELPDQS